MAGRTAKLCLVCAFNPRLADKVSADVAFFCPCFELRLRDFADITQNICGRASGGVSPAPHAKREKFARKVVIRHKFSHLCHCEVGDNLHDAVRSKPLLLDGLLEVGNAHRNSVPHENLAEMFELFGGIEVEGVTHYAEAGIVDCERYAVAVKDFAARCRKTYQP